MPVTCSIAASEGVPILEARALTKEFAGFVAVDNVDLAIRENTVHALVGPNGAGKTTLFNLLTKFLPPSSGQTLFRGRDITELTPSEVAGLGVVRSFQISAVFPEMTVLENVKVGRQRHRMKIEYRFWKPLSILDGLDADCLAILGELGLERYARTLAGSLPYGVKRAVEFAMTLALEPQLLLLDEPMAGMVQADVERVSAIIRQLSRNRTIVLIEHNLRVVADLSDRITVLQRGKVLAEGSYEELTRDPEVVRAYLGSFHA